MWYWAQTVCTCTRTADSDVVSGSGVLPAHARARPTQSTSLGCTARACTRTAGSVRLVRLAGCHLLVTVPEAAIPLTRAPANSDVGACLDVLPSTRTRAADLDAVLGSDDRTADSEYLAQMHCVRTAGSDARHIGLAGCHLLQPEHARPLIHAPADSAVAAGLGALPSHARAWLT